MATLSFTPTKKNSSLSPNIRPTPPINSASTASTRSMITAFVTMMMKKFTKTESRLNFLFVRLP